MCPPFSFEHNLNIFPMGLMEELNSKIDVKNQRFPCCIVWSPLPPITWILPFIGHTGICTEDGKFMIASSQRHFNPKCNLSVHFMMFIWWHAHTGIIWDFAGPYSIGKGRMAFGSPTRYMRLDPILAREKGTTIQPSFTEDKKSNQILFCIFLPPSRRF